MDSRWFKEIDRQKERDTKMGEREREMQFTAWICVKCNHDIKHVPEILGWHSFLIFLFCDTDMRNPNAFIILLNLSHHILKKALTFDK